MGELAWTKYRISLPVPLLFVLSIPEGTLSHALQVDGDDVMLFTTTQRKLIVIYPEG